MSSLHHSIILTFLYYLSFKHYNFSSPFLVAVLFRRCRHISQLGIAFMLFVVAFLSAALGVFMGGGESFWRRYFGDVGISGGKGSHLCRFYRGRWAFSSAIVAFLLGALLFMSLTVAFLSSDCISAMLAYLSTGDHIYDIGAGVSIGGGRYLLLLSIMHYYTTHTDTQL